jgi:tetratricopeptide (TPR) repeat protein
MFTQNMDSTPTHEVAFELGQLLAQQQNYDKALMQLTSCIELARLDLLNMDAGKLAEYYMHRAAVFEALGLMEHSKRDLHSIIEADPNFIQKYHS